jgi:hypothetical protein
VAEDVNLLVELRKAYEEIGRLKAEIEGLKSDLDVYRDRVVTLQRYIWPESPPPEP